MTVVTQHSVVKRGGLYWDRKLLPEDGYRKRLAALQALMAETGEDAWLMFGDVVNHGPVVYATNFMPRVRSALAYVPRQGKPVLFANISTRDIPAAKTITWVEDIEAFQRLPKSLCDFLASKHPGGAKLGLCGIEQSMPAPDWRAIEEALKGWLLTARDAELNALREKKDAGELEAMRRAAQFADRALDQARSEIRAGRTMRAVVAQLDGAVRKQGAEDVRFLVASGPAAGVGLRPVDDRVVAAGDPVLIYIAVQHQRYWAEAARTYVLGAPDAGLVELHGKAVRALDAMAASSRAGAQIGSIAASARTALGDAHATAQSYGLGNGIGLDINEAPVISGASGARYAQGSTVALRVIAHSRGHGVAIARTLHITTDGAVCLGSGTGGLERL